jgi:hypothetical protein
MSDKLIKVTFEYERHTEFLDDPMDVKLWSEWWHRRAMSPPAIGGTTARPLNWQSVEKISTPPDDTPPTGSTAAPSHADTR